MREAVKWKQAIDVRRASGVDHEDHLFKPGTSCIQRSVQHAKVKSQTAHKNPLDIVFEKALTQCELGVDHREDVGRCVKVAINFKI